MSRSGNARAGFTLTEIMIGMGIAGVVVTVLSLQLSQYGNTSERMRENNERDKIAERLTRLVQEPRDVQGSASLAGNGALRACLDKDTRNDCVATNVSAQVPIKLGEFDGSGRLRQLLAGTTAEPVSFGARGEVNCDPATTPRCPRWKARAFFWAQCAAGKTSCAQATTIFFRVQVYPAPEAKFRDPVPVASPPEPNFTTPVAPLTLASFAIPFQVRQTFVNSQACGAGSRQVGFDAEGRVQCECLPGTKQINTIVDAGNVLPVCEAIEDRCPPNLVAQGRDPAGKVICRPPRIVSAGTVMMNARRCRTNAWLSKTTSGSCSVVSGGSRKANPLVVCSTNQGTCFMEETP